MPFFGVPIRNGLPLGLGSVVGLAKQSVAPPPPPPSSDPYFEYVNLLLNTTSTNGAQNNTFLDSSTNNFTVTRNGDTTQGSFNPYMPTGYWSGYFDGTGDYLTVATNAAFTYGTGAFTIETWIKLEKVGATQYIIDQRNSGTANAIIPTLYVSSGNVLIYFVSNTARITGTTTLSVGVWYHVAVARSGTDTKLFLNGVQEGSTYSDSNDYAASRVLVASQADTVGNHLQGYVSNVRIVKGTAVYTAAFTPPTTPLTAITNTSLLCLQDNRFKDNSTNNFAITRNGDTRISKRAPFNPPASWDATTYGGSGYFDGTGDYLGIADSTAFDLNSTFTVECWFYQPAAGDGCFFVRGGGNASWSATNGHEYLLFVQTGVIYWMWNNAGTNTQISTTAPSAGQWHHIVVGYNGTTTRMWVNGVSAGTSTVAYTLPTTRNITRVGISPDGTVPLTGYVSNLRVVKGTDVYGVGNTTITPPTTPLTAITNTSLLLNFTNAGIYDASTINDVRTVGNLQVSTTQAKFGTTSMYFDGTGDYGDVLSVPENAARTGAFTLETWAYLATADAGVERYIFFQYGPGVVLGVTSGNYVFGAAYLTILASTNTIPLDQWVHIALVREGTGANQFKLYVNGVLADTDTSTRDLTQSPIRIGATNTATSPWKGYLDEMRMTNGYARYTGNFTPPTAAFPTL